MEIIETIPRGSNMTQKKVVIEKFQFKKMKYSYKLDQIFRLKIYFY